MTQPVTAPGPLELVSMLEELSGLALQISRRSDELQMSSQSDPSWDSASVCALLPVALSNAQNCLSVLQFLVDQTPVSSPPPPPFIPPVMGPFIHSPTPAPIPSKSELDYSVFLAESPRERWGTIESRVDSPAADPRFSSSRPTTPATRSWPIHPSLFNTTTSALRSTLGVGSDGERSPSPPLAPSAAPIRRGVPIAELVDEENSAPGTRGGINSSRPAETFMNMSSAHSYPPLVISIVDVTPRPTGVSGNGVRRMRDER